MNIKRRINQIINSIYNPEIRFTYMTLAGLYNSKSDTEWIKKKWKLVTGKEINLDNPKGFNEKLNWLKINYQEPILTMLVDKFKVREYVANKVNSSVLIPLIGVWDNPKMIDFDSLPNKFVLKCNHNSGGGMYICKNKSALTNSEWRKIINRLSKEIKKNYYWVEREWAYKNVKPFVIAEEYMEDDSGQGTLVDYKFYCFNGQPKFLYIGTDEIVNGGKGEARLSFFDLDFNMVSFQRTDHRSISFKPKRPDCMSELIDIACKLSENLPFVRVDLYVINNQVYFSELTLYPGGGFGLFSPESEENRIGDFLILPQRL